MLGVLDLGDPEIETAAVVADRIRHGLKYVAAERLIPAPDCGMKYMPRHVAFGKLKAMCDAAAMVRRGDQLISRARDRRDIAQPSSGTRGDDLPHGSDRGMGHGVRGAPESCVLSSTA